MADPTDLQAEETDVQAAPDASDDGVSFGDDIAGPTTGEPSDTAADGTASATPDTSDFDPASVTDWRRVDPRTLPESYRPVAEVARQLQAGSQKVVEEAREAQRKAEEREQNYLKLIEKQIGNNGSADAEDDPYGHLNEKQRSAVDAVREVLKIEMGGKLEKAEQESAQVKQALGLIAGHLQAQNASGLNDQAVALREKYGDDIDKYGELIKADIQLTNPATGKAYTLEESYLMRSGKKVEETIAAHSADHEARTLAASDTILQGAADIEDGKDLTENELLSLVGKLQGLHGPTGQ